MCTLSSFCIFGFISYLCFVGCVLRHINPCRLILFIHIKYIGFGSVGFYGISTIVGYLMPISVYTYILNISNLVGFGFMAYQILYVM